MQQGHTPHHYPTVPAARPYHLWPIAASISALAAHMCPNRLRSAVLMPLVWYRAAHHGATSPPDLTSMSPNVYRTLSYLTFKT